MISAREGSRLTQAREALAEAAAHRERALLLIRSRTRRSHERTLRAGCLYRVILRVPGRGSHRLAAAATCTPPRSTGPKDCVVSRATAGVLILASSHPARRLSPSGGRRAASAPGGDFCSRFADWRVTARRTLFHDAVAPSGSPRVRARCLLAIDNRLRRT